MNILFKKQEYYNSKNKIVPITIKKLINEHNYMEENNNQLSNVRAISIRLIQVSLLLKNIEMYFYQYIHS